MMCDDTILIFLHICPIFFLSVIFSKRFFQIQWYLNGRPLKTGSRVKTINDFGFVILEILPAYPEDSGEYTCRAINKVRISLVSVIAVCIPNHLSDVKNFRLVRQ